MNPSPEQRKKPPTKGTWVPHVGPKPHGGGPKPHGDLQLPAPFFWKAAEIPRNLAWLQPAFCSPHLPGLALSRGSQSRYLGTGRWQFGICTHQASPCLQPRLICGPLACGRHMVLYYLSQVDGATLICFGVSCSMRFPSCPGRTASGQFLWQPSP